MSLRKVLKGTGVAIVTPFNEDGSIDFQSLDKTIDFLLEGGINYLVTLGTTGEAPTIDYEEKVELINFTYEKVNGRVPIVIGVGGNNTKTVVKDLVRIPLEKATAVLSVSPYYNKPSQEGIYQHYKMIAENSPKPILLYNVTARTGRNLEAVTTIRLANEVENIGGIKEAGGNFRQITEILRRVPEDFLVTSGDDDLIIEQMALGMDGVISVAGNAFPQEMSQLVNHCLNNNFKEAKVINDKMIDAYDLMFMENNPAGIKAFMNEKGLVKNITRLPVVPVSSGLHGLIKDYLVKGKI